MITVLLCGGLGNQLFQIFAIMSYAMSNKHRFVFKYDKTVYSITSRFTYWDTFLSDLKIFTTYYPYNGTDQLLLSLPYIHFDKHNYVAFPDIPKNANVRVGGYFQTYKYFCENEDTIFNLIKLNNKLESVRNEYSHLFAPDKYNISMHFRLGDYKHLQDCHNVLGLSYFRNALSMMLNKLGDPVKMVRIIYFCEEADNDLVNNCYIIPIKECFPEVEFVKADDNIEDWKQMLVMACCDHNIIANSSFSWWGAYFNRHKDKIVVYPSQWFGPALNYNYVGDMFPPEWIQASAH